MEELQKDQKATSSLLGRVGRWIAFKCGFSQCRFCAYCNFDGEHYRGMRESILLTAGTCHFSKQSPSARLDYDDLRKLHRCPGFMPVQYNFKEYGFDPEKVQEIRRRRERFIFAISGWIVAVVVAFFGG